MKQSMIITLVILYFILSATGTFAQPIHPCVKDFPGRIAWSADGNEHDTDDFLASPWAIAIIRSAHMQDKLVMFGYNSHVWSNNGNHGQIMKRNIDEAAKRWGGFEKTAFIDEKNNNSQAVNKLVSEINKSTSSDPLWIALAGPMETVGRAVDKAQGSGLRNTYLLSHSTWNTDHANKQHNSKYTINYVKNKGMNYKKIKDQNGGFNRKKENFFFLRNHQDSRMKWLWESRKMPEYEKPSYQVGKYDCSDAGMAYWLITGALNGGNENGDYKDGEELLEFYLANPTPINQQDLAAQNQVNNKITFNGNNGLLNLVLPETGNYTAAITNLQGKTVLSENILNTSIGLRHTVNFNNLAPGSYIVHVLGKQVSTIKKIIKMNY